MKSNTKITILNDDNEKFFGDGPARLMRAIEQTGSLRAASLSMNMAYTKALKLMKNAEAALGFPLTTRMAGGKDGGGSRLTAKGKAWLLRYEGYKAACVQANEKLYQEFFPMQDYPVNPFSNIGCVIMASGMGKRFGGNKLMADFHGEPLITKILDVTEDLFSHRVVVTRHEDVAKLCQSRGIQTVFHDLPHRSDTIRLGLDALSGIDRCMFCQGDQPLLHRETLENLLLSSTEHPDFIWRTCYNDVPGSPVIFPQWALSSLRTLPEGKGGNYLIKKYPERLRTVSVQDMYELKDIDCPEDLIELLER